MILQHYFSLDYNLIDDVYTMHGIDIETDFVRSTVLDHLKGRRLVSFDNLKLRDDPNRFMQLLTFNITYESDIKCDERINIETFDLQMVANNI
jgi:hypothetical protein